MKQYSKSYSSVKYIKQRHNVDLLKGSRKHKSLQPSLKELVVAADLWFSGGSI